MDEKRINRMEKPRIKTQQYYDYVEIEEYLSNLLGYNIDNFGKADNEFRSFWHSIVDIHNVGNNDSFYIKSKDFNEDWEIKIAKKFEEEFNNNIEVIHSW